MHHCPVLGPVALGHRFIIRPAGTNFILGGRKEVQAKRAKMAVRGLASGKIFHDHALWIIGKRPIFGKCAIDGSKGSQLIRVFP